MRKVALRVWREKYLISNLKLRMCILFCWVLCNFFMQISNDSDSTIKYVCEGRTNIYVQEK